MRFRLLAVPALVLLSAVVAASPWFGERGAQEIAESTVASAARRDILVTVRALGTLEAARAIVISSDVGGDRGKIVTIIEDGATVEAGDVLVRLDPTPFEEEVRRLEARVREMESLIEANLILVEAEKAQTERDIHRAEADQAIAGLELAQLEKGDGPLELSRLDGLAQDALEAEEKEKAYLTDLRELAGRGYAHPAEITLSEKKLADLGRAHQTTRKQFENYRDYGLPARLEKARKIQSRTETDLVQTGKNAGFAIGKAMASLRQARQELDVAGKNLAQAKAEVEKTVIRAPMGGMAVIRQDFGLQHRARPQVGDVVWQHQPLIYLPDLTRMVAKISIREVDLHHIAPGQPAVMRLDAYPELRLRGSVASVGVLAESKPEAEGNEKYFLVTVSVADGDRRLRPGMTVAAEITAKRIEGALAVPTQAVFTDGETKSCYVRIGDRFAKREIAVGAATDEWAQILNGLREGEAVALTPPPADLVDSRPVPRR